MSIIKRDTRSLDCSPFCGYIFNTGVSLFQVFNKVP